jgi:hypothetical protein
MVFLVGTPLVILNVYYTWAITALPADEEANTPSPIESAIIATESEATTTMAVCAGNFDTAKLHVRIEPGLNGEVRGYLTEGEPVLVLLGEHNEPITKTVDDASWTLIQLPITDWVSSSHICK